MSRILIIEDETEIAELERDYLENEGYDVFIENRGDTGLIHALKEDIDLVILDIMLPGMDGFNVCSEIRNAKDIPVLLVSAKKEDEDKIKGLGFGADDYITKPFSPSELVARVNAHLARYSRLVGSAIIKSRKTFEVKGLRIEPDYRRVELDGVEKILTATEYEVLMFLIDNPNRVVSKNEIYEGVWRRNSYGDSSAVTVYIKRLREKLERDPDNPELIETIWGVGYRFNM
jgi:DNA-binding response OmpR family regulator